MLLTQCDGRFIAAVYLKPNVLVGYGYLSFYMLRLSRCNSVNVVIIVKFQATTHRKIKYRTLDLMVGGFCFLWAIYVAGGILDDFRQQTISFGYLAKLNR